MGELVTEFIIPARSGKAFEVKQGQVLRIIEIEGKQVADVNLWNPHDTRERLDAGSSMLLGHNFRKIDKIYSNRYNVMFTVIEDKVGVNFFGSHCAPILYQILYGVKDHPNCYDILAESIKPFGLTHDDVHDCFNVFMKVDIEADGTPVIKSPTSEQGDYVDWLAEMDCLVAISACPGDIAPTNDYQPKPLGIKILRRD